MLSIQTNVNSLNAQQNLNVNSQFMSRTIQQLTSGYRINSSGDDAAGLAVANQIRDNISQVTQGVANGNDAVAQLQIMDGGISNISQILDGMQTLAAESASSSFTGDRTVLNNEFKTDISEINRQAQAIGLNTGGTFAQNMAVYLGGGQGASSGATLSNGTVNVNLATSTVDAQSLGLNGVQAMNSTAYDLSASSATSVQAIVAGNGAAASTSFTFTGPGFGDTSGISVSVNLNGVADSADLVNNINSAIQTASQGSTGAAAAFKAANITASVVTNSSGQQELAFSSANAAFSATSGDATASALMGSFSSGAVGNAAGAITEVASGSTELATAGVNGAANTAAPLTFAGAVTGTQTISINAVDAGGQQHSLTVNLSSTNAATMTQALTTINQALQKSDDSTLQQITAAQTGNTGSSTLNFVSTLSNFTVNVGADSVGNTEGIATTAAGAGQTFTGLQVGTGSTADITTQAGATAAVSAVSAAVQKLGIAQAAIGNGEDQLNYAINLATSQITNFSAAESQIRDADIAQQAANLTKAQTLQQASIAAMAQANSAPQAVLSLLKG
ncbi:MAG TPA: flagellin [Bryobacteraceae bacterium]|jgi:flagellin|nr:flagellin [Bryobacteraceae bacterium]